MIAKKKASFTKLEEKMKLKKRLSYEIGRHRENPKTYWIVAIIILVIGFIFEFFFGEEHFQRSGSLVVIFAFFVAFDNLKYRRQSEDFVREHLKIDIYQYVLKMFEKAGKAKPRTDETAPYQVIDAQHKALGEVSEMTTSEVQKIEKSEGWIAAMGTIVWGYGDLVSRAILGSSNCLFCNQFQ